MATATILAAQKVVDEPLLIDGSSDINGSVFNDTIVQRYCSLHIRGNLRRSLTIELGANVVVEGSVDGKILNNGGRLLVNNKAFADYVRVEGPPEAEASGILKINLTAIALNWDVLTKRTVADCAAVLKGNALGCGIDTIAGTLAKSGCRTFFVSDITEAKRVRAVAPTSVIYVLNGLYAGTAQAFVEANARPVINSPIEMAEWDVFVTSNQWTGGCALNVDTSKARGGISVEEAAALAPRIHSMTHGITLLMSHLDNAEKRDHPLNERQISLFNDLRRLYDGIPASLANSSGIFIGSKTHFDLVRAGSALYGINPTPGHSNPMLPVIELQARIVQVRNLVPGETIANNSGWAAKRHTRLALASIGYADGYPRYGNSFKNKVQAMVNGYRCPIAGYPSMDLLPIDVTDLPDPTAVRRGEMVTLISGEIRIEDLAAAVGSTACDVLSHLGNLGYRFHRIYST
jgi:alanine racemase